MNDRFLVYGLVDPRSGQLRYIGKSSYGLKRARSHAYPGYLARDRSHCGNWVRELLSAGLRYRIVTIQAFEDGSVLCDAEIFWIAYFKSLGFPLTNITLGGEGCRGRVVSPETREKLRRINLGNKNSAGKKRTLAPEQRAAFAQRARERSARPDVRAKIATTLRGRKQSSSQVEKRLRTTRARWAQTPKKKFSQETKQKMSESAKRRWARQKAMRNNDGRS